MAEIVHVAGPTLTYDTVRRQRCLWCGALIDEYDLSRIARPLEPDEDPDNPKPWEPGHWEGLVAVDGNMRWSIDEPPDGKAPERSCMRLLPAFDALGERG